MGLCGIHLPSIYQQVRRANVLIIPLILAGNNLPNEVSLYKGVIM